jgi:hypothetical protein
LARNTGVGNNPKLVIMKRVSCRANPIGFCGVMGSALFSAEARVQLSPIPFDEMATVKRVENFQSADRLDDMILE